MGKSPAEGDRLAPDQRPNELHNFPRKPRNQSKKRGPLSDFITQTHLLKATPNGVAFFIYEHYPEPNDGCHA